jgi:dihydroxyacetone kinase-like protein
VPKDNIDPATLIRMFRAAAAQIRANVDVLGKHDSVGGDGDHGITMAKAMGNMEKAIDASKNADLKTLLNNIAWGVMGTDGGATGPLFGSFFLGMVAPATGKKTLDAKTLAAMFEGGLTTIQKSSKAKTGDKTMLDALIPAVQSMKKAAEGEADVIGSLKQAAEAAVAGAEETKKMVARFGRAKSIGEKSLGSPDAGAVSVSLIFRGFVEGAEANA